MLFFGNIPLKIMCSCVLMMHLCSDCNKQVNSRSNHPCFDPLAIDIHVRTYLFTPVLFDMNTIQQDFDFKRKWVELTKWRKSKFWLYCNWSGIINGCGFVNKVWMLLASWSCLFWLLGKMSQLARILLALERTLSENWALPPE